jgi:hypothetical protein
MTLLEATETDGVVNCRFQCHVPSQCQEDTNDRDELQVQTELLEHLNRDVLPIEKCKAEKIYAQKPATHLCEFSGGGDFTIQHESGATATVMLASGDNIDTDGHEDDNVTPVYDDEHRVRPRIELKHQPQSRDRSAKIISSQLQANMTLGLAKELHQLLLTASLDKLRQLKTMTTYGATFGNRSCLRIMKFTANFVNFTTTTSVRYAEGNSPSWAVDSAVSYLVKRLKPKSAGCATPDLTPDSIPPP